MTCGIYKLIFRDTNKVYIGQSLNIERRIDKHSYLVRSNTAAKKLQDAYDNYGMFTYEILCECLPEELDTFEEETIGIYDSFNNGFNSKSGSTYSVGLCGDKHPNSKFSNEQVVLVFKYLLDTSFTFKQIAELTKTNTHLVRDVANGSRHSWLKNVFEGEYTVMLSISRTANKNSAINLGIIYPNIKSPDGTIYNVTNVSSFARDHGLHCGHLNEVLNSKAKTIKGWCIVDSSNRVELLSKD